MKTATIEVAEEPGASVTVIVSPVPVGELFDIVERSNRIPTSRKEYAALAKAFVPFVASWTLEPELGEAGFMKLDYNLGIALARQWQREVIQVPLPLLVTSSDGDPSETSPDSLDP